MRYTLFFTSSLFPSWEGLGVGSSSLFPVPCSLLPKNKNFLHHKSYNSIYKYPLMEPSP
ncbi:MAG: hypothetical protein F6J90_39330 [Moorea sp. SIOASIH]|uniref:hypothetical protein n=1 Tax=Moorena sp. SIOASIH TaxID=2607817 RepID=UPI0013BA685B|nr:hypothetical protein [Moorena sp. SIOASIH]NEO42055.1 hypothetical protein [Moorena sp. SIOASIH]